LRPGPSFGRLAPLPRKKAAFRVDLPAVRPCRPSCCARQSSILKMPCYPPPRRSNMAKFAISRRTDSISYVCLSVEGLTARRQLLSENSAKLLAGRRGTGFNLLRRERTSLVALPDQTYEFGEQLRQRSFERPSRLLGSPSQTIGPRSLSSNGRPPSFVALVRFLKILRYREIIERIFDIRRDGQWSD
jgi:hypothetical protein